MIQSVILVPKAIQHDSEGYWMKRGKKVVLSYKLKADVWVIPNQILQDIINIFNCYIFIYLNVSNKA